MILLNSVCFCIQIKTKKKERTT